MARSIHYGPTELGALCADVSAALQHHGVVAIPTETYYGLGVNPFDAAALRRIAAVKGRPDGKPILVLIGDAAQLESLVASRPPAAEVLMKRCWPGPLTIVFPAGPELPVELTAGTGTVGVRWTSCAALAEILVRVGPLTGTSANRSGTAPFRTAAEVERALGGDIDLIVDAGTTPGGLPSTVVHVAPEGAEMVREGAIASSVVERVLSEQGFRLKSCRM
jgi:L-threonylcarbamoyladenylate synthase